MLWAILLVIPAGWLIDPLVDRAGNLIHLLPIAPLATANSSLIVGRRTD